MTAEQMKTRQELADELGAAARAYSATMDDVTRRAFLAAMKSALKAGMPWDLIHTLTLTPPTLPVSIR